MAGFISLVPVKLSAQSQAGQNFLSAYYRNERVQARIFFEELFRRDSVEAIRFAEEAEDLFMQHEGEMSPEALRLMVGVYGGAAEADEARGLEWRIKKLNLMLQHQEVYVAITQQALRECFQRAPLAMPLHQIQAYLESLIASFHIHDLTLDNFLEDWMLVDKVLMERSVKRPAEADEISELQRQSYAAVRRYSPDCAEVRNKNAVWFRQPATGSRTVRSTFLLLCLHDCAGPFLLDTVWPRLAPLTTDAYWTRLAALQSLNAAEYNKSLELLDLSISQEAGNEMKAHDLLLKARIWTDQKLFRKAAEALEEAMRLYPQWGQPYLDMADVIVKAAQECNFGEFDKRAVFWAAIDYCALAKNTDAHLESEANQRIYEYAQNCPRAAELSARNLQQGDSYPLHCWREVVTTVKVY